MVLMGDCFWLKHCLGGKMEEKDRSKRRKKVVFIGQWCLRDKVECELENGILGKCFGFIVIIQLF